PYVFEPDLPADLEGERQAFAETLLREMCVTASGRVDRELVIVLELDVRVAGALQQIVRLDPQPLGLLELPAVVLHEAEQRVGARLRPEASVLRGKIGAARELPLRPGELAE